MKRRALNSFGHSLLSHSVVIRDFHIVSVPVAPFEADSILIVDPDAVLIGAITFQAFQSIARQSGEIGQMACDMEHAELLKRRP